MLIVQREKSNKYNYVTESLSVSCNYRAGSCYGVYKTDTHFSDATRDV